MAQSCQCLLWRHCGAHAQAWLAWKAFRSGNFCDAKYGNLLLGDEVYCCFRDGTGMVQTCSAYLDSPCRASSFSFKFLLCYLLLIATTMTFHIQSTTSFLKQLTLSPFHASISTSVVHKARFALWCPCSGGCVFTKTLVDVGFQRGAQPLDLGRATRCWSTMVDICVFHQIQDLGGVVFNLI